MGAQTLAYRVVFYYRAGGKDYKKVQPFAKDLRIIADQTTTVLASGGTAEVADAMTTNQALPTRRRGAAAVS